MLFYDRHLLQRKEKNTHIYTIFTPLSWFLKTVSKHIHAKKTLRKTKYVFSNKSNYNYKKENIVNKAGIHMIISFRLVHTTTYINFFPILKYSCCCEYVDTMLNDYNKYVYGYICIYFIQNPAVKPMLYQRLYSLSQVGHLMRNMI